MDNPYSTHKLLHHPDRIAALREGKRLGPLQIHLMPQNLCNQDCHFCSYRMSSWKNSEWFDDSQQIPWEVLKPTLSQAREMGTQAIELTGGGEPLIYRYRDELLEHLSDLGFDVGLVSNGTAIGPDLADRLGSLLMWARISIDSGGPKEYAKIRRVAESQWYRAWDAVAHLAARMTQPEQVVGVGFVATNENVDSLLPFCEMAKDYGAHNVRLSLRFGPGGNDYYLPGILDRLEEAARAAASLNSDRFMVVDLISERRHNQAAGTQDYPSCPTSELLCVIGGDSKVYHCCTLAFNPLGLVGDLRERPFPDVWADFPVVDPRELCRVTCLYERRNLEMLDLLGGDDTPEPPEGGIHKAFI